VVQLEVPRLKKVGSDSIAPLIFLYGRVLLLGNKLHLM